MTEAAKMFRIAFGVPPSGETHVGGLVPLLGSITVPHEGMFLSSPVHAGVTIAFAPRSDGWIEIAGPQPGTREKFRSTRIETGSNDPAVRLCRHALAALVGRKLHFKGFSAALSLELPAFAAASLAEPETLLVALLRTLRELYPFALGELGPKTPPARDEDGALPPLTSAEAEQWAKLVQTAAGAGDPELVYSRARSILAVKPWHWCSLDCRLNTLEILPVSGFAMVLCELPEDFRGTAPRPDFTLHGRQAAAALKARSLRTLELSTLEAQRARLNPMEYAAARFVVQELTRIVAAERVLRQDDLVQFGYLLSDSQWVKPGETGPGLILSLAAEHPACLGSAVLESFSLHIVRHHLAPHFAGHLEKAFELKTSRPLNVLTLGQ